jgi:hypothetical protein
MLTAVFWIVTQCSLVGGCQHLKENCDTVQSCKLLPTFWRKVLPLFSAQIFGNHEKYYVEFQTKEHNWHRQWHKNFTFDVNYTGKRQRMKGTESGLCTTFLKTLSLICLTEEKNKLQSAFEQDTSNIQEFYNKITLRHIWKVQLKNCNCVNYNNKLTFAFNYVYETYFAYSVHAKRLWWWCL